MGANPPLLSFLRKRESKSSLWRLLDSRFRGNDLRASSMPGCQIEWVVEPEAKEGPSKSVDTDFAGSLSFKAFSSCDVRSSAMTLEVLTPANQLTILRMIFIPVFVILLVYDHLGWAFAIFILAGVTDGLDGLIARSFRQKTALGAYLDPIADKLLLITSFV